MSAKRLSRREFLTAAAGAMGAGILASCAPQGVETVVVKETVEVEKVVESTVEVEVPGETVKETVVVVEEVEKVVRFREGEPVWTPPDLSGKEYKFWGLEFDPHVEAYHRLADAFEEMTGAVATIEPQAWPIEAKVIAAMAAGDVPDVVCIMGKQAMPLVLQDALIAVDDTVFDMTGCDSDTWYSPVGIQSYQYLGKTWGIPTEGNQVSAITSVRMDFLQEAPDDIQALWPPNQGEAGFDSFEEMWAIAEALQVVEDDGTVSRWGMSSRGWDNRHLFGIMRTLGRDWWDPEQQKFYLDSDEAVEAMRFQVTIPVFERGIEGQLAESCTAAILAGKVAISCGNTTSPGTAAKDDIHIENCIYPSAIPGRKPLFVGEGGWGFVVPVQAKEPEVGLEFLKYINTYEGTRNYCEIYGGIISAAIAVNYDPDLFPSDDYVGLGLQRVAPAQEDTVYYGSGFGIVGEMEGIVSTKIDEVRSGDFTAQEACVECQALLEEMLDRYLEEGWQV